MSQEDFKQWHRLFGIALTDLFTDTPWHVELEKELALRSQILDIVIIERDDIANQPLAIELPDGLNDLRKHNLLTYKSFRESLDAWALEELIGHYVNYRKLLDLEFATKDDEFQLYAIATRFPAKLMKQLACYTTQTNLPGIFNLQWGTRLIRLIVLSRIAQESRNIPWELFSTKIKAFRHAVENYRSRHPAARDLLHHLYLRYQLELPPMAYTMEDFTRETHQLVLNNLTATERWDFLSKIPPEERLRGLAAEERLRGLAAEERLRGLSPDEIQQLKEILLKSH